MTAAIIYSTDASSSQKGRTLTIAIEERKLSSADPIFQVPFAQNEDFVGREDKINQLHKLLIESNGYKLVALFGLGGMGKTQVALQLAHEVQRRGTHSVLWLSAISMEAFESSCLDVMKLLRISLAPADDARNALKRYITSTSDQNWLLIVDNADDMSLLFDAADQGDCISRLLPRSPNAHILITTRFRKIATAIAKTNIIELHEMALEEAKGLLTQSLVDKEQLQDNDLCTTLVETLTCLPLAVSQAAHYMNTNDVAIEEYLDILNKADKEMVELLSSGFHEDSHYNNSQGAVATTWTVSFEKIRMTDPNASGMLRFMAWIEPKNIPKDMLPKLGSEQQFVSALGTLYGYGFLTKQKGGTMVDMHRLVQLATRLWILDEDEGKKAINEAVCGLTDAFPDVKWENRELQKAYMPHAMAILKHEPEDNITLSHFLRTIGKWLREEGRLEESRDMLQLVIHIQDKILAPDDLDRVASEHELSTAYFGNGQVEETIALLEHVVVVRNKFLAEGNSDRLGSQNVLAEALFFNGKIERALKLSEHIVSVECKLLPEDHQSRLECQHVLARIYQETGRFEEAIKLQEHHVALASKMFTEDNPERLACQSALAQSYQKSGRIEEGIRLLEYVDAKFGEILAEDHSDRLLSQYQLAQAYHENGQLDEAIKLLEHVVLVESRIFSQDNLSRLNSQQMLGQIYLENDQLDEAIKLLEHVVLFQGKIFGEDNSSYLISQYSLGRAYRENSQTKKAIEIMERVVDVASKTLGGDDPTHLAFQQTLGQAYQDNGQLDKAIKLLEHVVLGGKRLGEDDPSYLVYQHVLGRAYQKNGQLDEAAKVLEHVVDVESKTLSEDDPSRTASQDLLEQIYQEMGKLDI